MYLDLFYSSRHPLHWRSCQNFKIRNSLGDTATSAWFDALRQMRQSAPYSATRQISVNFQKITLSPCASFISLSLIVLE